MGRGRANNSGQDKRKARPRANNASNACLDRRGKWKQKEQRAGRRADKDRYKRPPPPVVSLPNPSPSDRVTSLNR